jgi:hypothetical protein
MTPMQRALRHRAMHADESELEMVQRHVREGERHLVHQREMIAWHLEHGNLPEQSERLLANFEDMQRLHLEHLARLTTRTP